MQVQLKLVKPGDLKRVWTYRDRKPIVCVVCRRYAVPRALYALSQIRGREGRRLNVVCRECAQDARIGERCRAIIEPVWARRMSA